MENPYSSPTVESQSNVTAAAVDQDSSLSTIARTVFLAWERLRLVYIAVLGLFTLLLTGLSFAGPQLPKAHTILIVVAGAIVANVCYFAGPVVETYISWLGYRRNWVRWVLFVGGTLLTMMLAFITLLTELLPGQD